MNELFPTNSDQTKKYSPLVRHPLQVLHGDLVDPVGVFPVVVRVGEAVDDGGAGDGRQALGGGLSVHWGKKVRFNSDSTLHDFLQKVDLGRISQKLHLYISTLLHFYVSGKVICTSVYVIMYSKLCVICPWMT